MYYHHYYFSITYLWNAQMDTIFINCKKNINHLYMVDIKLFDKNEKEMETLILAVKINSDDRRMEFGRKNMPCK